MTAVRTLRLGTRASALALAQSGLVAAALAAEIELVEISTHGDRSRAPLAQIGGTGVFVSALRDALLAGHIDLAVHSYKDLPTAPAEGLAVAAVPRRGDPRDVLVARDGLTLARLPAGARVGTGSPRRAAQLLLARPDLAVEAVRGNVDTRLALVTDGKLDAVVLAAAGLDRLGRSAAATEILDPSVMLPAPAQGALAVECRAGDAAVRTAIAAIDDPDSRAATAAERALLAALEAGCSAPVGALAIVSPTDLTLHGVVASVDGGAAVRRTRAGSTTDPDGVGRGLAAELAADLPAGIADKLGEFTMTRPRKPVGRITFVGAGPGDPGLLTARALDAMRRAVVVLTDADVPEPILAELPDVEIRAVTGEPAEIAKSLIAEARSGRSVLRLVVGDPFTTDSVVKECQAVARTTVPFDLVPGLPADAAVPAYAGVPVGGSRTVVDVRGGDVDSVDWATLATAPGPLVVTGDAADLPKLATTLVEHGRSGDTVVTVTAAGTTLAQRTVESTLDTLEADTGGVGGPVVLVLGAAVRSRAKLSWWESRALYGWNVLVPRTKDQAGAMSERLRVHGALPAEVPTIAVEPPRTPAQMERAIKGLVTGRYEWIVFTSVNAVRAVREKFDDFGLDARAFAGVKIACIGEATAAAVRSYGIEPELVPSGEQSSEGLLADFPPYDEVLDPIDRVLLPRADIATETLAAGLRERGWEIDDVTAYRTVRAAPPPAATREAIKGGGFDAVCFTSSSTVRNLVGIAGKPHPRTIVACIGPKTAETAREFGLRVDVQPDVAQIDALVDALAAHAVTLRENGVASPPPRRRSTRSKAAR